MMSIIVDKYIKGPMLYLLYLDCQVSCTSVAGSPHEKVHLETQNKSYEKLLLLSE